MILKVEWLERIREQRNWTQKEVASRAGITRHYYTMIANGTRQPSVKAAQKIAKALGFDWTLFFEQKSNESLHDHTA